MRHFAIIISLLFAFPVVTTCTQVNAHETKELVYPHVIILSFEGWGSSSFEAANMPFLKSKLPESAWTIMMLHLF